MGVARGPGPPSGSSKRPSISRIQSRSPVAASRQTVASSGPRCSWVKRRPSATENEDQPGPTRAVQSGSGGVVLRAAEAAGIPRQTFHRLMRKHGI